MKKIKDGIALFLYKVILRLVKMTPGSAGDRHLLVIKPDEIGDYILIRNQFRFFARSERYQHHKKTLVGNKAWKSLYDVYDDGVFDEVLWLDKKLFKSDLKYRLRFLKQVRALQASDVVNCVYSRDMTVDEAIAFVSTGNNKVAMVSDKTNRKPGQKNMDRDIYTRIVDAGDEKMFDPERTRNFLSAVLGMPDLSFDTKLAVKKAGETPAGGYFTLFLGAGNPERKWPVAHFAELAAYTAATYGLYPVLCGGPSEEGDAAEFVKLYSGKLIDHTAKTTLPFMLQLLAGSRFLCCVDTGILHMAAAAGCPVVGLYSGKFYKRFAPYPASVATQFYPVYPDFVDAMIAANDPVLYDTDIMRNDTMKLIPAKKALPFVDKIMKG